MLPNSPEGRSLYVATRDSANRIRRVVLSQSKGDMEALGDHVRGVLKDYSDLPHIRESVDFATQEGLLTEEAAKAAENLIAWGEELRRILEAA